MQRYAKMGRNQNKSLHILILRANRAVSLFFPCSCGRFGWHPRGKPRRLRQEAPPAGVGLQGSAMAKGVLRRRALFEPVGSHIGRGHRHRAKPRMTGREARMFSRRLMELFLSIEDCFQKAREFYRKAREIFQKAREIFQESPPASHGALSGLPDTLGISCARASVHR